MRAARHRGSRVEILRTPVFAQFTSDIDGSILIHGGFVGRVRLCIGIALAVVVLPGSVLAQTADYFSKSRSMLQIISPPNGATVSGPVDIEVTTSATAAPVDIFIDRQLFRSSPPYAWSWDSTAMADGVHTIRAVAHKGAAQIASAAIQVEVNNAALFNPPVFPSAPYPPPAPGPPANGYVELLRPTGGTTLSGSILVQAEASSAVSYVNVYMDSTFVASVNPADANATVDTTMTVDGSHTIAVAAFDGGGQALASDSALVMIANGATPQAAEPPGFFSTLPPHARLRSDSECAKAVLAQPSTETIPQNAEFNATEPTAAELKAFHRQPLWNDEGSFRDFARVDGKFTGTTDQIIRWASCKWGLDENAMRAEAWSETFWIQNTPADRKTDPALCQTPGWNGWNGVECWQSYGIFQSKVFDFNIWPETRDSTAFNADFRGAYLRACMNGDIYYLGSRPPDPGYPDYSQGTVDQQFWGCMGEWASGSWYNAGAVDYVTAVIAAMKAAAWLGPG
jgi:hypothetical protein